MLHLTCVLRGTYFLVLLLLLALLPCSGCSHSLSHEELQSEYRESISITNEAEAFLLHLNGHAYSPNFIRGHLAYLREQNSEIQSKLAGASASGRDAAPFEALKQATADLTHTLANLQTQPATAAGASSVASLHSIHERLEAEMPR